MARIRFALGAVAALCCAGAVQAQDQGVKQVEQVVRKAKSTVDAIASTKLQLAKTMDVYNGLMADGATDHKGLYKKLQSQMTSTEERRAEIKLRADEMNAEAEALFKSWTDSMAGISDPALRKRSEDRIAATRASLANVKAAGQKAGELYAPVMKALQDQVTYLGHDLNASAISSLKADAGRLNAQVGQLVKQIDETMGAATGAIAALTPQ